MRVAVRASQAMLDRSVDNDDVLSGISVPMLFSHGDADTSVLLAMAEHNTAQISGSTLSIYENVGHAPFYEDAERYNSELANFAAKCHGI